MAATTTHTKTAFNQRFFLLIMLKIDRMTVMTFHQIESSAQAQITALRLRCRAPSTRAAGGRVVQR